MCTNRSSIFWESVNGQLVRLRLISCFSEILINGLTEPEAPHAHPAGPAEYKAHFSDSLKKFQSGGSKSQSSGATQEAQTASKDTGAYEEFWQAPPRLWNPRIRNISEEEMDAVLVSRQLHRIRAHV